MNKRTSNIQHRTPNIERVVGITASLAAALAMTRLISNLLFGLTPQVPVTIALAILLMIAVATLAGYLPARRTARIDPVLAVARLIEMRFCS